MPLLESGTGEDASGGSGCENGGFSTELPELSALPVPLKAWEEY